MVRRQHENHLDELGASRGQLPLKPKKTPHAADAYLTLEDFRNLHAAVLELFARSSGIEEMKFSGYFTMPYFFAQV